MNNKNLSLNLYFLTKYFKLNSPLILDEDYNCTIGFNDVVNFILELSYDPEEEELEIAIPILWDLPTEKSEMIKLFKSIMLGLHFNDDEEFTLIAEPRKSRLILVHTISINDSKPTTLAKTSLEFIESAKNWKRLIGSIMGSDKKIATTQVIPLPDSYEWTI